MLFSNNEYADIHFCYGFCDGNAEAAVREYHRRYPNRRVPDARVFIRTHQNFRNFGLRVNNERNRNRRYNIQNNRILRTFDNNPRLSSRKAAQHLHIPKSKILRTLHDDHRHAYHLQPVQDLHPGDAEKRIRFCQWLLNSTEENPDFLHKILWTDESSFTRRGVTNYHNIHIWAHQNPREIRPRSFQNEFSVNVWLGVIDGNVCGPHFLPPRLNSELFMEFLNNNLQDYLEDLPINLRYESWIQLDGAPPHFGIAVREWLNTNYPQRWIGRLGRNDMNNDVVNGIGPVAWPPRSPDLNPLDFYVWGTIKDKVYANPVLTREDLILRIQQACNDMRRNPHEVSAAINALVRRCRKCIEVGGLHFEQFL